MAQNYFSEDYQDYMSDSSGGMGNRLEDRMAGSFSPDNPYARQIEAWERQGANKGKVDATLYDKAYEWEERYTNAMINYDLNDPLRELQRQRAAGFNPDIAGASSSSAGGSSSAAGSASVQSTSTPITNSDSLEVARTSNRLGAINTVSSLLGQVTQSVISLRQLPSRIRAIDAQANASNSSANLMDAQANEINELLAGKKSLQTSANASTILGIFQQLRPLLTSDSDISPILGALQVPDAEQADYKDAFKVIMSNPSVSARESIDRVSARKAKAGEDLFTYEYFTRVLEKSQQLQEKELDFAITTQSIQNNIAEFLSQNEQYAQTVAEGQVVSAENTLASQRLFSQKIERDAKVFAELLEQNVKEANEAISRHNVLAQKMINGERLTTREWNEYQYLTDAIPMITTLGSNQLQSMFAISANLHRNQYLSQTVGDATLNGKGVHLQNLQLYYGDVLAGVKNGNDIAHMWTSSVLDAVGIVVNGYVGNKFATKPQQLGQTIIDQATGNDGTMHTTNQRTIQNIF